jgi:ABC-type branched-subunit amino acid transport system substrate-binding protein
VTSINGNPARSRGAAAAVLAAAGLLALAACGSSGSGGSSGASASSSSGSSSGATTAGSDPITLFDLGTVNNPIQSFPEDFIAEQAAAKAINAAGGVHGHDIKIITCNGAGDQNTAADCARSAVSDHAVAVTGMGDPFTTPDFPILAAAKIPVVGPYSNGDAITWQSPLSYPLVGGAVLDYMAAPYAFKALGGSRMAVVAVDFPSALADAALIKGAMPASGVKYAGLVKMPETGVTDYSPYAAQLANLHAQGAILVASPGGEAGIIKAARAQGVNIKWFMGSESTGEVINQSEGGALDNTYALSGLPVPRDSSSPVVAAYVKDVQAMTGKSIDQDTADYSVHGMNAWLSVEAVAKVAAGISGTVDAASLTAALQSASSVNIDGFVWNPNGPSVKGYSRFTSGTEYVALLNGKNQLLPTTIKPIDLMTELAK